MPEFGPAYAAARSRISELVLPLSDEALGTHVPACPEWSVKDLVAHVTGIAVDILQGNVAEAGQEQWTTAQIAVRKDHDIRSVVKEWEQAAVQLEPALEMIHPAAAGGTLGDLITHEHDLRGAIQQPGARDSDGVTIALDSYVRWLGRRIRSAGLPTIDVKAGEQTLRAGKEEPEGHVGGSPFELLRSLTGRRTREQIVQLEWSVEPTPYLEVFSAYDLPRSRLSE